MLGFGSGEFLDIRSASVSGQFAIVLSVLWRRGARKQGTVGLGTWEGYIVDADMCVMVYLKVPHT